MFSKIKNIIVLLVVGIILVLIYVLFFNKGGEQPSLVSNSGATPTIVGSTDQSSPIITDNNEFLALLLSVNSIKLDDSIFSDPVWNTFNNNSIVLQPDLNPGRINPFAPLGVDANLISVNSSSDTSTSTSTSTNTNIQKPITN